MPENITAELNKISNWLLNNLDDYSGFTDLYGEIREKIVCSSLSDLYTYNCSLSGRDPRTATLPGPKMNEVGLGRRLTGSWIPVIANIPRKRLTIRRQATRTKSFRKKSRKSIMGDSSTPSKGQLLDTDLQLLDMAPFGRKVIAFNKLIRRELELMNLVLPLEFHQEVLNIIVSSSLQEISNDAAKILIQLDESLKVPEYGALLELCPAIGQLKSVSSPIVHALRLASDKNRSTIQKIIRDLELKGSDILDDFEDNVKSGLGLLDTF